MAMFIERKLRTSLDSGFSNREYDGNAKSFWMSNSTKYATMGTDSSMRKVQIKYIPFSGWSAEV